MTTAPMPELNEAQERNAQGRQALFTAQGVEWIARRWANRLPELTR